MDRRLTADRRELVAGNLSLAHHCHVAFVRRHNINTCSIAGMELRSAAYIGLVDAASRFDPARGLRFSTFAEHRIVGAMGDELRAWHYPRGYKHQDMARLAGLVAPEIGHVSERWVMLADTVAGCGRPVGWELEGVDAIEGIIRALPPREKAVMRWRYARWDDPSLERVAREMGLCLSWVAELHQGAMARLREAVDDRRGAGRD
jgi:DNA-directed RNA polymerase specialized sigma subunit